ncbi:hypothetical protein NFHSH190041_34410 [Shewanella sp. NFH-SH190041]|nr:hypothetical protein NFHSH190041_34410 [Shewanella sp. NFH-SH190041]
MCLISTSVQAGPPQPGSYNPGNLKGAYRIEIYDPTDNYRVVYAYSFKNSHETATPCNIFRFQLHRTYSIRLIMTLNAGTNYIDAKNEFREGSSTIGTIFALTSFRSASSNPAGYVTREVQFDDRGDTGYRLHGSLNSRSFSFTIPIRVK